MVQSIAIGVPGPHGAPVLLRVEEPLSLGQDLLRKLHRMGAHSAREDLPSPRLAEQLPVWIIAIGAPGPRGAPVLPHVEEAHSLGQDLLRKLHRTEEHSAPEDLPSPRHAEQLPARVQGSPCSHATAQAISKWMVL